MPGLFVGFSVPFREFATWQKYVARESGPAAPVAVFQVAGVYLDLRTSIEKALGLIRDAATNVHLMVLENLATGCPAWPDHLPGAALSDNPATKIAGTANSMLVAGDDAATLRDTAKRTSPS